MSTVAPSHITLKPPVPFTRFNLDQYHQMIRTGVLDEDDAVELLDGWIVDQMARNPPHDFVVTRLHNLLFAILLTNWVLRQQCAATLIQSEPEPDLCVARGPDTEYATRHPGPADIELIIEVSDTSLERDRSLKAEVYATAKLPVYWIVNILDRQIEVYSDPTGPDPQPAYRSRRDYRVNDLVPVRVGGQVIGSIAVRDLMPA
jgi:hypothetical protein